jgi:hypothetical protein
VQTETHVFRWLNVKTLEWKPRTSLPVKTALHALEVNISARAFFWLDPHPVHFVLIISVLL